MEKFKPSKKHLAIFQKINKTGKYKPTYSDQEPASKTLIRLGIVEWNRNYSGLIFTPEGKEFVISKGWI